MGICAEWTVLVLLLSWSSFSSFVWNKCISLIYWRIKVLDLHNMAAKKEAISRDMLENVVSCKDRWSYCSLNWMEEQCFLHYTNGKVRDVWEADLCNKTLLWIVNSRLFGCHCFILTTHMSRVLTLAETRACIPLKCNCSNVHRSVEIHMWK